VTDQRSRAPSRRGAVVVVPTTTASPVRGGVRPLEIVLRLCDALERAGVRYCHFKSNEAIDRSLSGDNDLDLLVDRSHREIFSRVLRQLGFRRALAPAPRRFPGIEDAFGLDAPSGRLVHVHVHHALVVGHDATKNVRLPIEDAYLASAATTDASPLPLPSPEFEYVVFVLRMVLKHATLDAVLGGQGRLPASARRELAYLAARADPDVVREIVRRDLPTIAPTDLELAADALAGGSLARVRAAAPVRRALAGYGRRTPRADAVRRVGGRITWNARRLAAPKTTRKRLADGGAIVAILGSDGSGKTTALDGLDRWLSEYLRTERVHLGKPPRSAASVAVRALQRIAPTERSRGRLRALRHVLIARDRVRAYGKAAGIAARGGIALCDRFPTPVLDRMDAPVLGGPGTGGLARLERVYYSRIGPPDALVVLDVSPEVARSRRPSDDAAELAGRAAAVRAARWDTVGGVVLDAERSPAEVLAALKIAVWDRLP
jgi:thymidylate kinase